MTQSITAPATPYGAADLIATINGLTNAINTAFGSPRAFTLTTYASPGTTSTPQALVASGINMLQTSDATPYTIPVPNPVGQEEFLIMSSPAGTLSSSNALSVCTITSTSLYQILGGIQKATSSDIVNIPFPSSFAVGSLTFSRAGQIVGLMAVTSNIYVITRNVGNVLSS